MKYYTEEQVSRMLVSAIDRTASLMQDDESLPSEEAIDNIIHIAKVHPSTFEMQKQIEAVGGLAVVQSLMGLSVDDLQGAAGSELRLQHKNLTKHLRTLTETLKPYLGDDKLEV
jgi:hypothetical protein